MLVFLSLGANLGNREQTLQQAIDLLRAEVGTVLRTSSFFYSEPWGFASEHAFCNLCVAIETPLSPLDLLHATQHIEQRLGRTHKSTHRDYQDRTIDIDILLYGNEHILTPELTIPHPLMNERDFVMTPLNEILNSLNSKLS